MPDNLSFRVRCFILLTCYRAFMWLASVLDKDRTIGKTVLRDAMKKQHRTRTFQTGLFDDVRPGDTLTRLISSEKIVSTVRVNVVDKTNNLIYTHGGWTFDLLTGVEIDHDLRWGPMYGTTGSYLQPKGSADEHAREGKSPDQDRTDDSDPRPNTGTGRPRPDDRAGRGR